MKLNESDESLASVSRDFESATQDVKELDNLKLPIVLRDLTTLETSSGIYAHTTAAYQLSQRQILVSRSFFNLTSLEKRGVLAHEVAHAVDHRDSLLQKLPDQFRVSIHPEEFLADWIACSWGLLDAIVEMRRPWGVTYLENLRLWDRESEYYAAMYKWNLRKSAGII